MAKLGDTVACQVVALELDRPVVGALSKQAVSNWPGSVTIRLLEGEHAGAEHIMVNRSVQNVPLENRVIGRVGYVKWDRRGSYNGWIWSKETKK